MTANYFPYYVLWLQWQQQAVKGKEEQIVIQQVEEEVAEELQEEVVQVYEPKSTNCELLYEVGAEDYLICDYARQQNAQANSNLAFMLMSCLAIGISLAAIIIVCVNRKVDEDSKHGGYYL